MAWFSNPEKLFLPGLICFLFFILYYGVYYTYTHPIAFVGEAGQIVGGTVVIVHHGLQIAVLFDFDPGLNLET